MAILWRETGFPYSMRRPLDHWYSGGVSSRPLCISAMNKEVHLWVNCMDLLKACLKDHEPSLHSYDPYGLTNFAKIATEGQPNVLASILK